MARKRTSRPTERDIQRQVKHLLTLAGCAIYDTSQGWRKDPGGTRMTPGLPDLLIFFPARLGHDSFGFLEVKTPEGLRDHQRRLARRESRAVHQDRFALRCHRRGIPYGIGGMDEAWAFLASVGLATREYPAAPMNGNTGSGGRITVRPLIEPPYRLVKGAK